MSAIALYEMGICVHREYVYESVGVFCFCCWVFCVCIFAFVHIDFAKVKLCDFEVVHSFSAEMSVTIIKVVMSALMVVLVIVLAGEKLLVICIHYYFQMFTVVACCDSGVLCISTGQSEVAI